MKYYLVAAACFCMLLSCEKEIKININQQAPKLVVDASIENNGVPLVALSTSLNYFNTISPEKLANSFFNNTLQGLVHKHGYAPGLRVVWNEALPPFFLASYNHTTKRGRADF